MKKILALLIAVVFILGAAGSAYAGDTDSHNVVIVMPNIRDINVSDPDVTLVFDPGAPLTSVTDNTATLAWTNNGLGVNAKITVATNLVVQTFTLNVQPIGVTPGAGTPSPGVVVNSSAQNIITNIGTVTGTCNLLYKATATAVDQGIDIHTITYTILDSI